MALIDFITQFGAISRSHSSANGSASAER